MKLAKPVRINKEYDRAAEKYILGFFAELLFKPINKTLKRFNSEVYNAKDALYEALINGTVQFNNGNFTGKFNSSISLALRKLGAKYNSKFARWVLGANKVPVMYIQAAAIGSSHFKLMHTAIIDQLDSIDLEQEINRFDLTNEYDKIARVFNKDIEKSLKDIRVMPQLTAEGIERLAEEYNNNMKLYIKGFLEDNIKELRSKVEQNAFTGYRAEKLLGIIQDRFNVSTNKAKFLARQETSLLLSKFKENRYKDAGITRYRWSTSNDVRVRDRHKKLNNKIFSFDAPPIVDDSGSRANPGEYFRCRCVAIGIID